MKLTNEEAISIANLIFPNKRFTVLTNEKELCELVCSKYKKKDYTLIQIVAKSKSIYIAEIKKDGEILDISYIPSYNLAIEYVKSTRVAHLLYWDCIPNDKKEEVNKKLTKLGF